MRPLITLALICACRVSAADAPKRPPITGIARIALYVHDMEKSRAYYKDFLGFGELPSFNKPDGSMAVTFLKVNDRQYIELFPEIKPGTDRLNHITIETDNAEALRAYLVSRGLTVPDKVDRDRTRSANFNVKDPDGHTLEMAQYEPDSLTTRENGKYLEAGRASQKIMHVGILVGALEPAMKFYRDILGFQEIWRGSHDGKTLDLVKMKVPDGDTYLELVLYDRLPELAARGTEHHMALEVPDIDKAKAALEARPARKNYAHPLDIRVGITRQRHVNLFEPDGTRAELMEAKTVDGVTPRPSTAPPPR